MQSNGRRAPRYTENVSHNSMILRRFSSLLIPLLGGSLAACGPLPMPRDSGPEPPGGSLVINEVMAANRDTLDDEHGESDDWIEIANTSDDDLALDGVFLSDDTADPQKFAFAAGTVVEAGGYVVVFADDTPAQGPLHAAFKLSRDGEELVLSTLTDVLDVFAFGPQCQDVAFGRSPDGNGAPTFLVRASPGTANPEPLDDACDTARPDAGAPDAGEVDAGPPPPPASGVVLNEALVVNATGLVDEAGEREPWVELFSTANTARDLSDHFLTDNDALPRRWRFPAGTTLEPGAFLVVFLDGEPFEGSAHAGFRFTGGTLSLRAPDESALDTLVVGTPPADTSVGRLPNGSSTTASLTPTPGAANVGIDLVDAGQPMDAGPSDAGAPFDAGTVLDAGSLDDAGALDAGNDGGGGT